MRPAKATVEVALARDGAAGPVDGDLADRHIEWMRRGVKANGDVARRRSGRIQMRPMRSSSIEAAGYDRERQALRVRYAGGSTYDYVAVPGKVFEQLLEADSKGRFVNWSIKPFIGTHGSADKRSDQTFLTRQARLRLSSSSRARADPSAGRYDH